MENPAVLLRRLNPCCARAMEGAACLLPDTGARNIDSLLSEQILPVLSQQLLSHMAAGWKPESLRLDWDDSEGILLAFDEPTTETARE